PPVGSLFAAFLGYNPMRALLGPALHSLPAARAAAITGRSFFPSLLSHPFHHGLLITFGVALAMCLASAAVSWSAGDDRAPEPDGAERGALLGLELDAMEAVPSGGAGRL
ncbi:MAG: MFS transporter, partial [Acidimicrobiales bacterium]